MTCIGDATGKKQQSMQGIGPGVGVNRRRIDVEQCIAEKRSLSRAACVGQFRGVRSVRPNLVRLAAELCL